MDRNTTTTTITLIDVDSATTTRITLIDGPTDATVLIDGFDRVDNVHTGEGRSWVSLAFADEYGLTDSWTREQLATFGQRGQWIDQPHSRGHRCLIVNNQDAARAFARAEAVGAIGRAVLAGAHVALRDVNVRTPEAIASLEADPH